MVVYVFFFFFSSRRRHTRWPRDWSSDVCSSDLSGVESSASPITTPEFEATVETRDPWRQLRQDALHHVAEDAAGVDATNQDDRLRCPAVRLPILRHLRLELDVRRETLRDLHLGGEPRRDVGRPTLVLHAPRVVRFLVGQRLLRRHDLGELEPLDGLGDIARERRHVRFHELEEIAAEELNRLHVALPYAIARLPE